MILHLTNDYAGSTVYKNLVAELDRMGLHQTVYTPIKTKSSFGKNRIDFLQKESKLIYSLVLNKHIDRILFKYKIRKLKKNVAREINFDRVSLIHAHTWFSDGAVAYEVFRKHNIPYIITIRNSDINVFWKLPYLKNYGLKILESASKVIFISEAYKKRIVKIPETGELAEKKGIVIPNGVDKFWIKNSLKKNYVDSKEIKLLYVGKFNSGKNVINLLNGVLRVKAKHNKVTLSLVGGGGNQRKRVLKLINSNPDTFIYHGQVKNKQKLLSIYREHQIFVMPSKYETFGLVYIEALLQGLPVLYTKDEGISGMYGPEIGEAVEQGSSEEIARKINLLIDQLPNYDYNHQLIKDNHNWNFIAKRYIEIYNRLKKV